MRTLVLLFFNFILFLSINAQDSLNCKLLATTGNLAEAFCLQIDNDISYSALDNKFYILDLSDIDNPVQLFADTLSTDSAYYEINGISIRNNRAYLACRTGLIVLDITDKSSPTIISQFLTTEYIEAIEVKDIFIFLGTLDFKILIIEVTDETNPNLNSTIDNNIDDVWDIEIRDSILFAATEDTGAKIYNISDTANPALISSIPHSTIVSLAVKDSTLLIANPNNIIYSYNISDLNNPVMFDSITGSGAAAICIEDNYAYTLGMNKISVIDISIPSNLQIAGFYPIPARGSDITVNNKTIYAACQTDGIYIIKFGDLTAIEEIRLLSFTYKLQQNYPNPFNPETTIKFSIPIGENVTLKIYDILGKEVKTLINDNLEAGSYTTSFNGSELASGIYIYRLTAGSFTTSKKMLLLK